MKNYVITILNNPKSVEAAERCIKSGAAFNIEIEKWPATTPSNTNIEAKMREEKILQRGFIEVYSRPENCMAAFLSHFSLWKTSAETNKEITIFEHDAVIVNNIPDFIPYSGCISLGKPSYGKFNTPASFGVGPLVSKRYFPGAHAYRIKPAAAKIMIHEARMNGRPTDVFLNTTTFPGLQEYYPWPVEAVDGFTTIQKTEGCLAKHRFTPTYEIIDA